MFIKAKLKKTKVKVKRKLTNMSNAHKKLKKQNIIKKSVQKN